MSIAFACRWKLVQYAGPPPELASKGKSMVAALRPMGKVALLPQGFLHTEAGLEQMAYSSIALGEDTRYDFYMKTVVLL